MNESSSTTTREEKIETTKSIITDNTDNDDMEQYRLKVMALLMITFGRSQSILFHSINDITDHNF
jgi:hypothetical protein